MIQDQFEVKNTLKEFYSIDGNSQKYFHQVVEYLSASINLDLSLYREKYLNRRLYYRLLKLPVRTYREYLQYLHSHPEELMRFKKDFTIHVTQFFRDESPFRFFEKTILPHISTTRGNSYDETIHILSAPCSSGEEPYSLAIIADFLKEKKIIRNKIVIDAWDIEPDIIEHAKTGIYREEAMKNISELSRVRNFDRIGENAWQIKSHLKKYVNFGIKNLLVPFKSSNKYDFVACRNFLIYVDRNKQQTVLKNVSKNMNKSGFLMLGKTEGYQLLGGKEFDIVNNREHYYKLKN